MTYACLPQSTYQEDLYKIVPYRHEDIYLIMQWRNEQMAILRQNQILTPADQEKYYNEMIEPTLHEKQPDLILFSFLYRGECIGYGGLTHINWEEKRAEVSFLLATGRAKNIEVYQSEFGVFLSLLKRVAFQDLDFKELFTETFDIRPKHIEVLEKHGFIFQKKLNQHASKGESKLDSIFHICRSENGRV